PIGGTDCSTSSILPARTSEELGGRPPPFTAVTRVQIPSGTPNLFRNLRAQAVFFAGTARMKSFVVAPVRFPGQQAFTHQRSVIFWSQPSLPMWVPSCQSDYLNCDIACNIMTRCQLLMFSILTWQLRHCGVTEVLPASFCWLL